MSERNIYKGMFDNPGDNFDHYFACWANNHMGWAKMKKYHKKLAKKRLRRKINKDYENGNL